MTGYLVVLDLHRFAEWSFAGSGLGERGVDWCSEGVAGSRRPLRMAGIYAFRMPTLYQASWRPREERPPMSGEVRSVRTAIMRFEQKKVFA